MEITTAHLNLQLTARLVEPFSDAELIKEARFALQKALDTFNAAEETLKAGSSMDLAQQGKAIIRDWRNTQELGSTN